MPRHKWLDASLVPLEKALLARAEVLSARGDAARDRFSDGSLGWLDKWLADEFRALAEALHEF